MYLLCDGLQMQKPYSSISTKHGARTQENNIEYNHLKLDEVTQNNVFPSWSLIGKLGINSSMKFLCHASLVISWPIRM